MKIKRSPILDIEKELAKHMQIIRSQHPYKELPSITKDTTPFNSVFEGCFIIDKDGVKIYNTYMDSYYDREEKYYRILLEKKLLDERMFELSFSLGNEGTDETGNINIFVKFPDGIKLYTDRSKKNVDVDKPMVPPAYSPFTDPRLQESMRLMSPSPSGGNFVKIWNLDDDNNKRDFSYITSAVNHHVVHSLEEMDGIYNVW